MKLHGYQGEIKSQKIHYVIQCNDDSGNSWTTSHRFSHFVEFRDTLVAAELEQELAGNGSLLTGLELVPFPRKTALPASNDRQTERESQLEMWLNTVISRFGTACTPQLRQFLDNTKISFDTKNDQPQDVRIIQRVFECFSLCSGACLGLAL